MERGLIAFAFLVTGGLTLILGRPASSNNRPQTLETVVVSAPNAETRLTTDTLHRGENLAAVMGRQALNANEIDAAVKSLRAYASPRTLRPGVTVAVERTAWDSLLSVTVRVDADNLVELTPAEGGWISRLRELPVTVDTLVLAGRIQSSLYNSVMALESSELRTQERIERVMWGIYRPFQWTIDFGLDLRRGDHYRAVYERTVRADGSVKNGRILAVHFTNRGRAYEAYWYEERGEYFDADGGSMKRVFLKAPVDFRRISSRFARRRYHPVLRSWRAHKGVDYSADSGTRVHSTAVGTVTRAGWWGGYGNMVEVKHINGYRTRYAHLSFVARGIKPGVRVRQGQLIGHVGATGLATGPHLHYELRKGRKAIDPYTVDLPSGEPVAKDRRAHYRRTRDSFRRLLDGSDPDSKLLAE